MPFSNKDKVRNAVAVEWQPRPRLRQTPTLASKLTQQMEPYLNKKYKLTTSEYFDEYLKFLGVGLFPRKIAGSVSPVCVLSVDNDDSYLFTMASTFRTFKIQFTPGKEFDEDKPDGTKVRSLIILEKNTMLHTQTEASGRKSTILREFTADTLTATITVDGWDGKCVRIHKVVP